MFELSQLLTGPAGNSYHIHFVGVAGTAMASVAAELHRRGVRVTGSDESVYPPMSTFLADAGVRVFSGYRPEHLAAGPDLVVIGNAMSRGNPEVEAVLDGGLPYCSLPELLRWAFLPGRTPLVVTGTHGKTTTSALCAWALQVAGEDPCWLVGGVPVDLGRGFRVGDGPVFVLEGDEYDTAFFDKRAKFVHYQPRVLILNNLEFDHADIYRDLEEIRRAFRHLLRTVPSSGTVVANGDDSEVVALAREAPCRVVTYSLRDPQADWYGAAVPGRVEVAAGRRALQFTHRLIGRHQGWNVLGAAAALEALGLPAQTIVEAVGSFRGVKRRGELRGVVAGVRVYDDFAHHPTAIRGTLEGFRDRYPDRRIWAVVEPRSNTMRRRIFQDALVGAFDAADEIVIREVPNPEKVPQADRLDVLELARDLNGRGRAAAAYPDAAAIVAGMLGRVRSGDVIVVLSNGGFEGIHERLIERLRAREGGSG